MRYSIEPRDRIYVKGYGFLSCAKKMGTDLSNKYSQKLLDTTTDAIKTALKIGVQKTAEATGDLIGNKVADKITNHSKKPSKTEADIERVNTKKRYISQEERQQIIDELWLV